MIEFNLNGRAVTLDLPEETSLLTVLANDLNAFGPKYGCGAAQCGSCYVLVGDAATPACVTPLRAVAGAEVTTLAGLREGDGPGRTQRAFIAEQAAQCGYCLSGMIIAAEALLRRTPRPTIEEARAALDGNLCRCGAHNSILRAVVRAGEEA